MLSTIGTTPGKALLNIRLRNEDGSRLSYTSALTRSAKVAIMGQGVGIPIIALVTHICAYNRLTQHGITSWDESGRHVIAHKEINILRIIILALILVGFLALIVWAEMDTY